MEESQSPDPTSLKPLYYLWIKVLRPLTAPNYSNYKMLGAAYLPDIRKLM
jgi:hypothetical protein